MNDEIKLERKHSSSKNKLESFSDRLKFALGDKSARSLALDSDLSPNVVTKYLNGESTPNVERLVSIARTLGCSVEWLATGGHSKTTRIYEVHGENDSDNEFAYINMYDAEVSMGSGAWNDSAHIVHKLAFRKDWLAQHGLSPDRCAVIMARGDSMEDTISDGATLLINLDDATISRDGIYVIMFDGHLMAKRLQRGFDGSLLIMSDNKAYSDITVAAERVNELRIVGRVVLHSSLI